MEKRDSMEFFLQDNQEKKECELKCFYLKDENLIYVGRELLLDDLKMTYYFLPTGENEALLFLYAGDNIFDEWVKNIDKYNEKDVAKAFPLFMEALKNGISDNYSKNALIRLPHIGKNGSFWCFATKIENIDFSDLENKYVVNKMTNLFNITTELFNQLEKNEISGWDAFLSGMKKGFDLYRRANLVSRLFGG